MSDEDDLGQRTTAVPTKRAARAADDARAALRVVLPADLRRTIVLADKRMVIGRQPGESASATLLHQAVSRRHFAIDWDAARGAHTGVDLESSNGSFVDGQPAAAPLPLADGSVIRLGPAVVAVYERSPGTWAAEAPEVSREALPGESAPLRLLRAEVARVARDPSPVLVIGETGTGKELLAAEIHRLSGRAGKLVAVNCAALSPQLVESQLFGHVRGAFTGAHDAQAGLFREADGGTLFLDEIGELPLELQPKLLRAIQEREVRPVGNARSVQVDVRIVAATNRDLAVAVEAGTFRRDLYARLALWELRLPPVRARRADVLDWIERLARRWQAERSQPQAAPPELDGAAAEALLLHGWPDNLRGLDRLVHALARTAGPIGVEALPAWVRAAPAPALSAPAPPVEPMPAARRAAPTREELEAALARADGSVRATARYFGRDRKQIYRWMEAFGLKGKDEEKDRD